MRQMIAIFAVAVFGVWIASQGRAAPALGDVICEPTARLEARLKQTLMAERRAMGIRSPEQVVEVWIDNSGDWALVARYATGASCILAIGENWTETVPPAS